MTKSIRIATAGLLIAATPISTTAAAVRPNAAVPAAGSTAVTAQGIESGAVAFPWLPVGIIALTIALAVFISVDKDGNASGSVSRG